MKKKIFPMFIFTLVITYILSVSASAQTFSGSSQSAVSPSQSAQPEIMSQTAIVADADSGLIYYQKNMHQQMYPASITKIMTGILAVEKGRDTDVINVTGDVTKGVTSGTARIYLTAGEQITQEEALYTMFLPSANDSANALAVHIGGTIDNFAQMMNARAKELGTVDTHFSNANGLPDKNNVTSAYDMAMITKKALSMPGLMKYFGARSYTMPATNKQAKPQAYYTQHWMLSGRYKYDGVFAGKTGWETMSGFTLVTAAKRNGRTLICVTMKCPYQRMSYKDTKMLLDYGFAQPSGGGASSDYLKVPVTVKAPDAVTISSAAAPVTVKQVQAPSDTKNKLAAPLLLLAISICLFTFLVACRLGSKKAQRNGHGRSSRTEARPR